MLPSPEPAPDRLPDLEQCLRQTEDGLLFVMEELEADLDFVGDCFSTQDLYESEVPVLLDIAATIDLERQALSRELGPIESYRRAETEDRHRRVIATARRRRGLVCDPEDVVLLGETL